MICARFLQFVHGFFNYLALFPTQAPPPTFLNVWMGRKRSNSVDGEMTRWRTFLLKECGFRKKRGRIGRWVKREVGK